jgi:membrane protein YqaA with SNARE-associated domain
VTVLLLFATCLAGAVLPVVGSEVLVLGAASVARGPLIIALIVLAAAAQSIGKILVYGAAATGARSRLASGFGTVALRAAVDRSPNRATAIVFVSALASVPPLYATTLVCGAAGHGPVRFGLAVFAARIIRYAVLVAILDSVRMAP